MIKISTKFTMEVPKLDFSDELLYIATKIFVPTMQSGIQSGMAIDGSALPKNEPATIAKKNKSISQRIFTKKGEMRKSAIKKIEKGGLKALGMARPLIDTGTLLKSFKVGIIGFSNQVRISLTSIREDIGRYLQIEGIKSKTGKKYYRFFGINQYMHDSAVKYIEKSIGKKLHGR